MSNIFAGVGSPAWDFIQTAALFLLTMLTFFGVRDAKYSWLNRLLLAVFALQWALVVGFRGGLTLKLFATLLLATTLMVEAVVGRRIRVTAAAAASPDSRF